MCTLQLIFLIKGLVVFRTAWSSDLLEVPSEDSFFFPIRCFPVCVAWSRKPGPGWSFWVAGTPGCTTTLAVRWGFLMIWLAAWVNSVVWSGFPPLSVSVSLDISVHAVCYYQIRLWNSLRIVRPLKLHASVCREPEFFLSFCICINQASWGKDDTHLEGRISAPFHCTGTWCPSGPLSLFGFLDSWLYWKI